MFILLTSEKEIQNEANLINQLFQNGLEVLHLRKPTFDKERYRNLLTQIDQKYYSNIMLHQFHELCSEFGLRGVHLQEQPRIDLKEKLSSYVNEYRYMGYQVSSSFHTKSDIKNCIVDFEYVLLSPVFSSISKVGYQGKGFDVNDLNELVVGMGGIQENSIKAAIDLGFRGVGVLGGVWNSNNPIQSFKDIYNAYQTVKSSAKFL